MCGIAGTYGEPTDDISLSLQLMTHRGPDGRDIKMLTNGTLGHTRLAIIDIDGGDQPLSDMDGRRWLVCNGEIYNFPRLRPQFSDYPFQTNSDSEIILALYERYGFDAVKHLDGMFAFVIVEGQDIFMARDPLGIKPLYYAWEGDTLHFASEIKALHNSNIFDIKEFPQGHFYSNKTGFVKYYDVVDVANSAFRSPNTDITPKDVYNSVQSAVHKRLMADVPVGVFLSGGLDSSIVAALSVEAMPNIHSFSVGYGESQDLIHAQKVADHIGTNHHQYVYTDDEMVDALPEIIYHLESFDPSLVRSAIPNYFLCRLTSDYVTVVLSGEGADELYAGYHYLKQYELGEPLHEETVRLTDSLHNCNLQRCDRMTMAHAIEGRVPFLDTESVELAFSIPVEQKIKGDEAVEKWVLRKAFEDTLPHEVTWRVKEQFSEGAGSAHFFEVWADDNITDTEFSAETDEILRNTDYRINSKEELLYYREFVNHFPDAPMELVQPWRGQ